MRTAIHSSMLVFVAMVAFSEPAVARDAGPLQVAVDAGNVNDAGEATDGGVDAGTPVAGSIEQLIGALTVLVGGRLQEGTALVDLIGVPLNDDVAVEALATQLRASLARFDEVSPDGGEPLDVVRDRLSLRVLELPLATRQLMVAAEDAQAQKLQLKAAAADAEVERIASALAISRAAKDVAEAAQGRERTLAEARLALERVRAAQATRRSALTQERGRQAALVEGWNSSLGTAKTAIASATPAEVDVAYDGIVAEVTALRKTLEIDLGLADQRIAAPRVELEMPSTTGLTADQIQTVVELTAMSAELAAAANAIDADTRRLNRERAEQAADAVYALNDIRLKALERVSAQKHDRVLGLGDEGLRQLQRELHHVVLIGRYIWIIKVSSARETLTSLPGLTVTRLSVQFFMVAVMIVAATIIKRRGRAWLELVKVVSARLLGRGLTTRIVAGVITAIAAILDPLVVVGAVAGAGEILSSPLLDHAAGQIPYGIVLAWSVLRLVVTSVHQTIRWLARPQLGALSKELSTKALGSVQLVGRFVFALSVFLYTSEAIVGRGYLYTVAVRVGWVLTLPMALLLVRRWQDDIAATYLRLNPNGRLAAAVVETRTRWFGFFVVLAAFGFVASSAALSVAGRFVMNFDQTRKALAFVFRRRLERRAREQPPEAPVALPDVVEHALRIAPAEADERIADRLIDIDVVRGMLSHWMEHGGVGAVAVVGLSGMGKTTWLKAFVDAPPLAVSWVQPQGRVATAEAAFRLVGQSVDAPEAHTADDVKVALLNGPKRIVVIDDAHLFWLRGDPDRSAWNALNTLIADCHDHVFFVCSLSAWSFEHLRWADPGGNRFRRVVELDAWTEPEIHTLLSSRTARSEYEVLYDDLVIAKADLDNREMQLLSTAQEYARLLWDFADGSPATALDAWRRSLHPVSEKTLRVRLFQQPPDGTLERLDAVGRFTLAAVTWNNQITTADAARSLLLRPHDVEDAIRRLLELGVIVPVGDGYSVHVAWWSMATRFLLRKHLIAE